MTPTYEYKIASPKLEYRNPKENVLETEIWLNKLGDLGWKLIHVDSGNYTFIRVKSVTY